MTTSPFELVSIDFVHLKKSHGGYEHIFVIVDHFIRYVQAYATWNKSAKTVANKLYNDFMLCCGFPHKIRHNQGGEFETKLFWQIYNNFVTYPIHKQHHTTPKGMAR